MTDTSFSADNKSSSPQDNGKLLVEITEQLRIKQDEVNRLSRENKLMNASKLFSEISKLADYAATLTAVLEKEPIKSQDFRNLSDIEPKRKSVQNMLEIEVAKTIKFKKLLKDELGEKSPYEMRMGKLDWRNDDTKTVPVITVPKIDLPDNIFKYRKANKAIFSRENYLNLDTNFNLGLSNRTIDEIFTNAGHDDVRDKSDNSRVIEARIAALFQIDKLINNAICFDSHISEYGKNSKNKSPNTLFMHKLYSVVNYEGKLNLLNLSVEEAYKTDRAEKFDQTSVRIYNIKNIEITPVHATGICDPSVHNINDVDKGTRTSVTTITIPQLYNLVKTYDKSFYENPTAIGRPEREAEIKAQAEFENAKALYEKYMDRLDTYDPEKGVQALSEVSDKCDEKAELMTDLKDKLDEITEQKEYQRRGGHER